MAAIAFAFGPKPALDEFEALELAELLGGRRNLAAFAAAAKIRDQARRDPDRRELSTDVELTRAELGELAAVLAEPRAGGERPAFERLRAEVGRALNRIDE